MHLLEKNNRVFFILASENAHAQSMRMRMLCVHLLTPICRSVVTKKGRQISRMRVHLNSKPMEFNTHACKLTTFFVTTDLQISVMLTEVFRLVDTKFANNAELNSCSLNLRPLHLYDSIFYSHEFILHMRKFYRSTNLKTSVRTLP